MRLGRSVAWNAAAQASPQVVTFVLTPVLLARLGATSFGVWTICLTCLAITATLDGGVSASLLRFFSMHRGAHDASAAARLLRTVVVSAPLFVLVVFGLGIVLLAPATSHSGLSGPVRHEISLMLPWLVLGLLGALWTAAGTAVLAAHDHYPRIVAVVLLMSVASLASVLAFVQGPADLHLLAMVYGCQSVAVGVVLVLLGRRCIPRSVGLASRHELGEVARFAGRTQLSSAAALINTEVDALLVGTFFSVGLVGFYGAGASAAAFLRSVPLFAVGPVLAALSRRFGFSGAEQTLAEFQQLNARWLLALGCYIGAATVAVGPLVGLWLGSGSVGTAQVVAVVLTAGFGVNLTTGCLSAYVRAIGRPQLEVRYGLVAVILNVALTPPLALLLGVPGLVGATALGAVLGSAYFWVLCARHAEVPLASALDVRAGVSLVVASGVTGLGELLAHTVASGAALWPCEIAAPALGAVAGYAAGSSFRR